MHSSRFALPCVRVALFLVAAAGPLPAAPPGLDTAAPQAQVVFPLPSALTDRSQLVVRGTARDATGVTSVHVNGVAAVSADGFRTWFAGVPLRLGSNSLVVRTEDVLGNVDPAAATCVVRRDALLLREPSQVAYDAGSGRCYVSDMQLPPRILEIDAQGTPRVLSAGAVGSGVALGAPTEMELDRAGGRLLVNDIHRHALLAVDLASGDRSTVSGPGVGVGPALVVPQGLAFDAIGARAWVVDAGTRTLVEVDLGSGDRRVVASPTLGGGPPLDDAWGLDLLPGGRRALVSAPWDGALMLVDVVSGERRIVSDELTGQGPALERPLGVALLSQALALVADNKAGTLFSVDLATGDRTAAPTAGHPLGAPGRLEGLELDLTGGRALVVDRVWGAVLSLDLWSGVMGVVFRTTIGDGPALGRVESLVVDPTGPSRALTIATHIDAVVALDLATGRRSILSGAGVGTGPPLRGPVDLAIDLHAAPPRLLVLDDQPGSLLAVDLASGDRTLVSGAGVGTGGPLSHPQGVALDPDPLRNRALVLDTYDGELLAVDLGTGDRTVLSGVGLGLGPTLTLCYDLDVDPARRRVLAVNVFESTVVAVDLASGSRTLLSGQGVGSGPQLHSPYEILLDADRGRALVSDNGRVLSVDLATGARALLAGYQPRRGPGPGDARGLVLHAPAPGLPPVLLFADWVLGAVGIIDLAPHPTRPDLERQRTIVSR